MHRFAIPLSVIGLTLAFVALCMEPPSRPGIDAPALAHLGEHAVGVRTVTLVQPGQVDPLGFDPRTGTAPKRDRALTVDIWYPAAPAPDAVPEIYRAELPAEPPLPPAAFSVPGIAVRDAKAIAGKHPLVIVSHGYSNVTAVLTWLTENLASKGYVVAAIRHEDPSINDRTGFPQLLMRRPLDIGFVARELQRSLGDEGIADPARTALVGYSMGGYGVLTSAGAALDPAGPLVQQFTAGLMAPWAAGGSQRGELLVKNLRAVVALAPAGGALAAWGKDGVGAIGSPLLLIAGDHDHTVDYASGARAIYEQAVRSDRYLLTYRFGGHAIGLNPVPDAMRARLWDLDWFEDPVWRKERIIAINLHMITAFLDRFVKDDVTRAAYLDVPVTESSAGDWTPPPARYDETSGGGDGITVWKGFQRRHAEGLELLHRPAAAR